VPNENGEIMIGEYVRICKYTVTLMSRHSVGETE